MFNLKLTELKKILFHKKYVARFPFIFISGDPVGVTSRHISTLYGRFNDEHL